MGQFHGDALFLHFSEQQTADFAVYGWQGKQTPLPFDDRHFRTEGAVDESEFTTDNPAADNDQMFGHGLQLQRVVAGQDKPMIHRQRRQLQRRGPGGENDPIPGNFQRSVHGSNPDEPGADKFSIAANDTDLQLGGGLFEPGLQGCRHLALAGDDGGHVRCGGAIPGNAELPEPGNRVQRVRRRTQRLRRDAARVQARSAEVGAFDESDFNSSFRGGECGGVTSGAAPDDGQLHDALPPLRTLCDTLMPSKMDAVIRQFLTIFAQWSTLAA